MTCLSCPVTRCQLWIKAEAVTPKAVIYLHFQRQTPVITLTASLQGAAEGAYYNAPPPNFPSEL